MRKMKKINGFLVVRFNEREKKEYPELGNFGVIDAELYTGGIDVDRGVMEYDDAETIETAAEQARGLDAEEDFAEQPPTYTLITEDNDHTTEMEISPQLLIKGWETQLKTQVKSKHYPDIDPRTAAHELYGYKLALCDLGILDWEERAVDPDHFAPRMAEQPLPRDTEELLTHICDQVCKYPMQAESQGKLDSICAECAVWRLASEAEERELCIAEKAKERLDGIIRGLAETQLATKATALECEARAYLEALVTTKTLTEQEATVYGAAIAEAVKGRPEPPGRETFANIPAASSGHKQAKRVYALGLALAEKCPDNDCKLYLNTFNMARELDAALDEINGYPAEVMRRELDKHFQKLGRMYYENRAIQYFKEEMKA